MTERSVIALRLAAPDEDRALRRLAELDSAAPLTDPVLVALVDGTPAAALSLADGRAVADPFQPTDELVALLRQRAGRVAPAGRRRRPARRKALRLAHA